VITGIRLNYSVLGPFTTLHSKKGSIVWLKAIRDWSVATALFKAEHTSSWDTSLPWDTALCWNTPLYCNILLSWDSPAWRCFSGERMCAMQRGKSQPWVVGPEVDYLFAINVLLSWPDALRRRGRLLQHMLQAQRIWMELNLLSAKLNSDHSDLYVSSLICHSGYLCQEVWVWGCKRGWSC
jgi:hypothetical protein